MPGTTRQGNALTDPQDGDWIGNLFSPEDPSYNYGGLLPIRERKGDDPQNPSLELAWPSMVRELAQGTKNLILGAGGEKAPLSDTSDAMSLATGGRMTNTSEAPLLAMALRGVGVRGEPNDLGIFAGQGARRGPPQPDRWFKGVDDKMRFEVPDYNSKFRPERLMQDDESPAHIKSGTLDDVLDHPELFEQYPHFRNIVVSSTSEKTPTSPAAQMIAGKNIWLNASRPNWKWDPKDVKYVQDGFRPATDQEMHSTLLHELQHVVQNQEEFTPGTSRAGVALTMNDMANKHLMAAEDATTAAERNTHLDAAAQIKNLIREGSGQQLYHQTAGEVEARLVQSRFENREGRYSPLDPDVPVRNQIVLPPHLKANIPGDVPFGAESAPMPPGWGTTKLPTKTLSPGELAGQGAADRYGAVPEPLMGFGRTGSKSYEDQRYPHEQAVSVTWPDGQKHFDYVKGLNETHALARAHRNWPGARIEAINSVNHDPFKAPSPSNPHPVDHDPFKESK